MAIFTLTGESSGYIVTPSVIETDCSSSYTYSISASQSDVIDIAVTGNHGGAYYMSNGVKINFATSVSGVVFNNSLSVGFHLKNSGESGVFLSASLTITNLSSGDSDQTYTDNPIRKNDNLDCDYVGLTADPTPEANQIAVFTSDNSVAGSADLTFDGNILDVEADVSATGFIKDGGISTEYLMADGSTTTGDEIQGDLSYVHDQATSSATWNIAHNLGKLPSVTVVDTAGSVVIGNINYTDANNLVLVFNDGFSGQAYVN